jgi:hypothetical protein
MEAVLEEYFALHAGLAELTESRCLLPEEEKWAQAVRLFARLGSIESMLVERAQSQLRKGLCLPEDSGQAIKVIRRQRRQTEYGMNYLLRRGGAGGTEQLLRASIINTIVDRRTISLLCA